MLTCRTATQAVPCAHAVSSMWLSPPQDNQSLRREPGVVVSKSALSERLEPLGEAVNFGAIDVHVFNLRSKIGGHRIRTVRGVGYMLVQC